VCARRRPHLEHGERFTIDPPGAGCPRGPRFVSPVNLYLRHGSQAFAPGGGRVKVHTYEPGRTCAALGCATILSTYNRSSYCALHNADEDGKSKHRVQRPLEERPCPQCGQLFATANPKRRYCGDPCRMAAFQGRRKIALPRTCDR
jgi:hypothetical protein